jgi:hypothetical protein
MYRIDDATAATSLPAPEAAGTEGYFTEGNPATGTPPTKVRGSWLNMIQEELRALVVAAGFTPSKTVYTQVRDASLALTLIASGMNCQLVYSGSNLVLNRYKGRYAYIPGSGVVNVPSGGVSLAPSGLTANTLYYIYLTLVGSTPTLIASTTGHSTDATTGIEIMTGDNTKLFVGMERAAGTTSWQGLCRSWYNDPGVSLSQALTSIVSINGPSNTSEISTSMRIPFICFSGEIVQISSVGENQANLAGNAPLSGFAFDGVTLEDALNGTAAYANSSTASLGYCVNFNKTGLSEGYHYGTLMGVAVNTYTASWIGTPTLSGQRCTIRLYIAPRK